MAQSDFALQFLTFFFTAFGGLLGSFSNVVILRMAEGKSVIFPPSRCPKCEHQLHAIDLVPVLSWVYLRGKCRYCQTAIAWQYPVVEAIVAAILGLSFFYYGLSLRFVVAASRAVIWFVALVVFLRGEIKKPEPFTWAAFYFYMLEFPVNGCPLIGKQMLTILLLSASVGLVSGVKTRFATALNWSALSFLYIFVLSTRFKMQLIIPLLLAALLNNFNSKYGERLFFAASLAGIFAAILYQAA